MPNTHDDIETDAVLRPTPCPERACANERRLRALERTVGEHGVRLHEGDIALVKLNLCIERLTDAIDRLEKRIDSGETARAAGSPTVGKVKDAVISWAVPAIILGGLWVLAKSGVIPGIRGGLP